MMTLNKIPFKEVNGAGLFVDTVYGINKEASTINFFKWDLI